MEITLLKSKLHRACVTHSEVDYEGSCAIDADLLELANIREYEQIDIYNVSNGERFTTYAIRAEAGSRIISVNGAAAHKANPGDRVIICTYARFANDEADQHKPSLVYLNKQNHVKELKDKIAEQAA